MLTIDLQNNLIPYVDTLLFVNSDGTVRFPNLKILNLSKNSIVFFDFLFPLTIPSAQFILDASDNPIRTLNNTAGLTINSPACAHAVVGGRSVNLKGNQLTVFDDSNLLQYGLQSELDLQTLLYKISNYDLRQENGKSLINCFCPFAGQLTSTWYAELLNRNAVNASSTISQLSCSNISQRVFVLNFNCTVSVK